MSGLARFRAKTNSSADRESSKFSSPAILHVDMDAFFVSVELLARPELRGKPVVVGGRPNERGVVSAASYEARRYGVHSAMPLRTAARLCPHAVFLDGNHQRYWHWSDRIATILAKYSPVVERVSIDEAYLDLSGTERLQGPPFASADKLLREISRETGLACSAGLARTRLVAKVASDQAKPQGLLWVPEGSEAGFLAPLGVRKIPGIGRVTEAALKALGIDRVGQLAAARPAKLEQVFGRWGTAMYRKAQGEDAYEFLVHGEPKSISQHRTFRFDEENAGALASTLSHLSQKAAKRLREAGLDARTITLTIRYAGFETITRARTLAAPTNLDPEILHAVRELFHLHWDRRQKIRLLAVSLSSFTCGKRQLELLEAGHRSRLEELTRAADCLRDRFGFSKVQFGSSLPVRDDHS